MYIYLMRHGTADTPYTGSESSLTASGRVGAEETAEYIKSEGIQFDVIISSPKLRAAQTAEIVAKTTDYPIAEIIKTDTLKPNAMPTETMRFLSNHAHKQAILCVGHLPSMPRLAAALIGISSTHPFPNATLYRIEVDSIPPADAKLLLLFSPE
jgi:phosphohistidine phosphatase